jgi:hypothetical protein
MRSLVMLTSALGVASCSAAWPHKMLAQADPDRRCWAPSPPYSERTDWYDAEGQFVHDTGARSIASLVERFAGDYRLLVVTSEGGLEKEIIEYRLRLARPTRPQSEQIARIPAVAIGRLQVPLVAVLEYERGALGQHAMKTRPYRDLSGVVNFEYWPASGKIGFNVGLGFDTGTLFQVTDVRSSGPFSGRWQDGGLTAVQVDTPIEPVLEHVRGYFCALPRSG